MIAQRFAKGLKEQDWAAVVVEVLVVVIGVYVGIFIGEAQQERDVQREVNRSLVVLLDQMKVDLVQLDRVIASQEMTRGYYQGVMDALEAEEANLPILSQHLQDALDNNRTFYPNRSAYQSMRDQGYLAQVRDPKLVMGITVYFESVLERHRTNSIAVDAAQEVLQVNVRDQYWDRREGRFLGDETDAKVRMWNGFRRVWGSAGYYIGIMRDFVRPQLVSTIKSVEDYLKREGLKREGPIAEGIAQ